MSTKFTPNFGHLQGDESIKSPSEFARRMLVEYVRAYAAEKGISHREIARVTGMKQPSITRVLSGRFDPKMETFLKIASALNLHIDISD